MNGHLVRFLGGPGPGCDSRIVILDALDDETCNDANLVWLDVHVGDYVVQANQMMDLERGFSGVSIEGPSGSYLYCFDVSDCWTAPEWPK